MSPPSKVSLAETPTPRKGALVLLFFSQASCFRTLLRSFSIFRSSRRALTMAIRSDLMVLRTDSRLPIEFSFACIWPISTRVGFNSSRISLISDSFNLPAAKSSCVMKPKRIISSVIAAAFPTSATRLRTSSIELIWNHPPTTKQSCAYRDPVGVY